MVTYSVNNAAVAKMSAMIEAHEYVLDSEWSKVRPTSEQENEFIERNGWEAFGQWYLGINDEHDNPHAKNHYGFVVGDFHRVQRQGLIAAIDRAGEWHHDAVEAAARKLLDHLDAVHGDH